MKLKHSQQTTHIALLYNLISVKPMNDENIKQLTDDINKAIITAKEEAKGQIVSGGKMQHVIIAHPSGRISLYRQVGLYDIIEDASKSITQELKCPLNT